MPAPPDAMAPSEPCPACGRPPPDRRRAAAPANRGGRADDRCGSRSDDKPSRCQCTIEVAHRLDLLVEYLGIDLAVLAARAQFTACNGDVDADVWLLAQQDPEPASRAPWPHSVRRAE